MPGCLFVCSTPIGNLGDVTFRLLEILASVDVIAAEDTRRTRKLLTNHDLHARLVSYHEANEVTRTPELVGRLQRGERIALVTDAGTPAVSDPGYRLIGACIDAGIPLEVIPGPSAVLAALVVSGLPTARFAFEGFLARKPGERRRRLEGLAEDDRTLVFFEAPSRLQATLEGMLEVLGPRRAAVARELTKVHEEVRRGTLAHLVQNLREDPIIGEIVIVVEGRPPVRGDLEAALAAAQQLAGAGESKSAAAAHAAAQFGVPRRQVYEGLLEAE